MSDKKRKRRSDDANGTSPKKVTLENAPNTVKVSVIDDEKKWQPILVSSPGLQLPRHSNFKVYETTDTTPSNTFLHSGTHPTLDYTTQEDASPHLAHYIVIYDPRRQRLKLIPAKSMTVRSSLKTTRHGASEDTASPPAKNPPNVSARSALGLAFGTKKSRKAIRELTTNAIASGKPLSEDKVASAVLSSMPKEIATTESIQAEVDLARPIPRPNMSAVTPAEVYTIGTLVGSEGTLSRIKVQDWMETISAGGDVGTRSHYIAKHMVPICNTNDVRRVRLMRYTYLLILWYKALRKPTKAKGGKSVPKMDVSITDPSYLTVQTMNLEFGKEWISDLNRRFAENGQLTRWHEDNVTTHILALTLLLDNYQTDTYDIQQDLGLEVTQCKKYYQELACEVRLLRKAEYDKIGIGRVEAMERRIAQLKLPLKLPQRRRGAWRRR